MNRMVIIDVGSTTTKALLFEESDVWRLKSRGESPTTVEFPDENIMIGILRSLQIAADRSGIVEWFERTPDWPKEMQNFLITSSAGGGLQMAVCGNIRSITAMSAERAALGGGAILLDVFAADDGRNRFQRLERLRDIRPDMILLAGGVEGAEAIDFMIELCDFIRTAQPKAKYGYKYALPIIYAGASSLAPMVRDLLGDRFALRIVPNLRPTFDTENLNPTRQAINSLFVQHVMAHAPGYEQLAALITDEVIPTPTAVGSIISLYAKKQKKNVLCCDIGGATTDIFSVTGGIYRRSVSANNGMSYSLGHVIAKVGLSKLLSWLPFTMNEDELLGLFGNKMLYPTTIPATPEALFAEHAAAREALNMSYADHIVSVTDTSLGVVRSGLPSYVKDLSMENFDIIIGSGGVLSNAPLRGQAAAIIIDAFQPIGRTELLVDAVFMLPHLGALAEQSPENAISILERDGLVSLGTVLAPKGQVAEGFVGLVVQGRTSDGREIFLEARGGQLLCIPLTIDQVAEINISVHNNAIWQGDRNIQVKGGACGLILDLRGRPLEPKWGNGKYDPAWLSQLCQGESII